MLISLWHMKLQDLESYNKLITRMKKQQAIIRIAKKLLSRIRQVWLSKQLYSKLLDGVLDFFKFLLFGKQLNN